MRLVLHKDGEPTWGLSSFCPRCVYLEAYLKMCGVAFRTESCTSSNASPSGVLPALEMDGTLLGMGAGADSGGNEVSNRNVSAIVEDLKRYGLDIDAHLSRDDLADMTAYASMVESQLVPATLWAIWGDNESFSHYTQAFYSEAYPVPLNYIFPRRKRQSVSAGLKALAMDDEEQVKKVVEKVYSSLSSKLRGRKYFFGGRPSSLDVIAYSYLSYHRNSPAGQFHFGSILEKFPSLVKFVDEMAASHHFAGAEPLNAPEFKPSKPMPKPKKPKKMTEEERVFIQKRNRWLVMVAGVTVAYFIFGNVLDVSGLLEEVIEDED